MRLSARGSGKLAIDLSPCYRWYGSVHDFSHVALAAWGQSTLFSRFFSSSLRVLIVMLCDTRLPGDMEATVHIHLCSRPGHVAPRSGAMYPFPASSQPRPLQNGMCRMRHVPRNRCSLFLDCTPRLRRYAEAVRCRLYVVTPACASARIHLPSLVDGSRQAATTCATVHRGKRDRGCSW